MLYIIFALLSAGKNAIIDCTTVASVVNASYSGEAWIKFLTCCDIGAGNCIRCGLSGILRQSRKQTRPLMNERERQLFVLRYSTRNDFNNYLQNIEPPFAVFEEEVEREEHTAGGEWKHFRLFRCDRILDRFILGDLLAHKVYRAPTTNVNTEQCHHIEAAEDMTRVLLALQQILTCTP